MVRLGETDHLPAPIGRHLPRNDKFHQSILRDVTPAGNDTDHVQAASGSKRRPWDEIIQTGFDPDTYVYGQCLALSRRSGQGPMSTWASASTPRATARIRRSAPRTLSRRSVLATYRAGGKGRRLFAELRWDEPDHARRGWSSSLRTRTQVASRAPGTGFLEPRGSGGPSMLVSVGPCTALKLSLSS